MLDPTITTQWPRRRLIGPSTNVKRSCIVAGQKTSISLEGPFWKGLKAMAAARGVDLTTLLSEIDRDRPANSTLASAARVYVFTDLRTRLDAFASPIWG
jgi:predicted DNA-binding ribbon-helix-helix protein